MKSKQIKYSLFLLVVLISVSTFIHAQSMPKHPPENFNINTDRDLYLVGERLWFSAVDFLAHDKEMGSKVLYVELFDRYGKSHLKQKCELKAGISQGSFLIPEELASDYYFFRVYTALLRNYPPHYFPEKRLIIVNPEIPFPKNNAEETYKILFQGDGLVNGLVNDGYLWISDQSIHYKNVSILASNGEATIAPKQIIRGLYAVEIDAKENTQYEFLLDIEESDQLKISIPKSEKDYLMKTSIENEQIQVQIESNNQGYANLKDQKIRFEFYDENLILRKNFETRFTSQTHQTNISIKELNKGIYYLRVLDNYGKVLAYKLISYIDSSDQNPMNISLNQEEYTQGDEVHLLIETDHADSLLNYSTSVVKKGSSKSKAELFKEWMNQPNPSDLQQLQFLSPAFFNAASLAFFSNQVESVLSHLSNISPLSNIKHIPETRALNISGRVVDEKSGAPIKNVSVILSQIDKYTRVHLSETKSDGSFAFPIYHQYKSKDLFLSTLGNSHPASLIQINNDFCNEFPEKNVAYPEIDTSDKSFLEELWLNQQLTDYTQDALADKIIPTKYDSLFGFSQAEIVVRLQDYIDLADMETVFSEIVPFVSPRKRKGNFSLVVFDEITGSKYHDPLVLVDNIPLNDVNKLMEIKPSKIEEIQVINRIYYLGDNYLRGVILVKSKAGNFAGIPMPDDAIFLKYQMLQQPTTFLTAAQNENSFRNVLFWSPNNTSKQEQKFIFNTSQHLSDYEVIVRGVLKDGQLFEERKSFKVVK